MLVNLHRCGIVTLDYRGDGMMCYIRLIAYFAIAAFLGAIAGRFLQPEAVVGVLVIFAIGAMLFRHKVPKDEVKRVLLVGAYVTFVISAIASFLHFIPNSGLHAVLNAIHEFLITSVFR